MKKKYLLIFLLMLMIIPIKTNAADLNLSFKKTGKYNCDMRQMILPTYDNNANIDGHLFCINEGQTEEIDGKIVCTKYDLNNNVVWEKETGNIDNITLMVLFDGFSEEYEVKGGSDILITKYSDEAAGEVEWNVQYGGNNLDLFDKFLGYYNKNGELIGYLLIGSTWSTDIVNVKPGYYMVLFDLEGNKLWEKNIVNLTNSINGINTTTVAGEYQIGQMTMDTFEEVFVGESDMYINKFIESRNANGVVDGYITVGSGNADFYIPNDFFDSTNNELSTEIETSNVIVKYDLSGNEVWKKSLDEFTHSALFDVIVSKDLNGNYDGYIAVGTVINEIEATSEKEVKGIVIKYDLNGNVIWKKLHEDKETYLMTIAENYNDNGIFNGYIIGGKIFEESTAEDTCDLKNYILKYTYNESKINTNVSKGGSLTIDNTALPGEVVKINVTADEGYVIEKITVLDNSGKEVEIKDNSFIMPEGEVNISVSFARLTNPQTAAIGYTIVLIILIVVIGTFTVKNKKVQEIEMLDF